jgi:hypothetical protein
MILSQVYKDFCLFILVFLASFFLLYCANECKIFNTGLTDSAVVLKEEVFVDLPIDSNTLKVLEYFDLLYNQRVILVVNMFLICGGGPLLVSRIYRKIVCGSILVF